MQGGASAGMVPWLSGLKLGREMSTHPGRSMLIFAAGLGFAVSLRFAAGLRLCSGPGLYRGGLEFAAGVENALGEAGYPC